MTHRRKRLLDFGLYIVIGLVLVAGVAISTVHFGTFWESSRELIGLGVMTAILFGYAANDHKVQFRRVSFWAVMLTLLLIHVLAFVLVLQRVENWSAFWFIPLYPVEFFLIYAALRFTGHDEFSSKKGKRAPKRTVT